VTAEATDDSLLAGCRVWCIDDDVRVCEATRTLLERWGCRVELAAGADAALAAARSGAAPEILLLDVLLGDITGPELYPQLAALWGSQPPAILVTAERDQALRDRARASGWGFLPKPVRPPALRALMMQLRLRNGP